MPTFVLTCNCSGAKTDKLWTQDEHLTAAQDRSLRERLHHHACTKQPRCWEGVSEQHMWNIIGALPLAV